MPRSTLSMIPLRCRYWMALMAIMLFAFGAASFARGSQYEVHKIAPVFSHKVVFRKQAGPSTFIEHDPVGAELPLPKGPHRPWQSIGKQTELNRTKPRQPRKTRGPAGPTGTVAGPVTSMDFTIDWHLNLFPSIGSAWETNVASGGDVILYTANFIDAYSVDRGRHFTEIDPFSFMASLPADPGIPAFCCDQVVQYVPKIGPLYLGVAVQQQKVQQRE